MVIHRHPWDAGYAQGLLSDAGNGVGGCHSGMCLISPLIERRVTTMSVQRFTECLSPSIPLDAELVLCFHPDMGDCAHPTVRLFVVPRRRARPGARVRA